MGTEKERRQEMSHPGFQKQPKRITETENKLECTSRTRCFFADDGLGRDGRYSWIRRGSSNAVASPQQTQTTQTSRQKLRNPLNELLDEAQAAIEKNEFTAAIAPLQKFIAEQPDVAYAHFQLAYCYTNLKKAGRGEARIREGHRTRSEILRGVFESWDPAH